MAPFLRSFRTPQVGVAPFLKHADRNNGSCPSRPPAHCLSPAARLMSDDRAALRRKYGKYLPHQRANVDQVPLPFVNDMDSTYDEVGAKRVSINQLGPA